MTHYQQKIYTFYSAFQQKDYKSMQQCYADHAVFNDPVFVNLNAKETRAMWEMFCTRGKDLQIGFSVIDTGPLKVNAQWVATYTFSKTNKKVVNRIHAEFVFENDLIVRHTDDFNFYRWASQALGLPGILLGWTPFLKNKVRKSALKNLQAFIKFEQQQKPAA
jgi:hypothetical protein